MLLGEVLTIVGECFEFHVVCTMEGFVCMRLEQPRKEKRRNMHLLSSLCLRFAPPQGMHTAVSFGLRLLQNYCGIPGSGLVYRSFLRQRHVRVRCCQRAWLILEFSALSLRFYIGRDLY